MCPVVTLQLVDAEERDGVAQYAIYVAHFEHRAWNDPELLAVTAGVRVIASAPRGCHGIAVMDPPTIWVGPRRNIEVVAHELGHIATEWCAVCRTTHDESETDDIARRIVIPSGPLRKLVKQYGARAVERYPEHVRKIARRRVQDVLAELREEDSASFDDGLVQRFANRVG